MFKFDERFFWSLFNSVCRIVGVVMFAMGYSVYILLEGLKSPALMTISVTGMILSAGFTFMTFPSVPSGRLVPYGLFIAGVVAAFLFSMGFAWFFLGTGITIAIILSLVIGLVLLSRLMPKDNHNSE